MRRTHSTVPARRCLVIAAALVGYLWLTQTSAFGASTELVQARGAVWGAATLALAAGVVFGRKRFHPKALTAKMNDCVNVAQGLAGAFSRLRDETTRSDRSAQPNLRVRFAGHRTQLDATVEAEICEIGREALLNALRHAHAENIEIALTFDSDSLRVVVRDDGCGIAQDLVTARPEAYRGLAAMRDRAERIGGRLRLRSAPRRGTELELRVPVAGAGERTCCAAN